MSVDALPTVLFYCVVVFQAVTMVTVCLQPDEQKDDLSSVPPAQRKAKLERKISELRDKINHETSERLVNINN